MGRRAFVPARPSCRAGAPWTRSGRRATAPATSLEPACVRACARVRACVHLCVRACVRASAGVGAGCVDAQRRRDGGKREFLLVAREVDPVLQPRALHRLGHLAAHRPQPRGPIGSDRIGSNRQRRGPSEAKARRALDRSDEARPAAVAPMGLRAPIRAAARALFACCPAPARSKRTTANQPDTHRHAHTQTNKHTHARTNKWADGIRPPPYRLRARPLSRH